ncbi:MAG: GNAT family N-acetyltransferase [Anaerolineae bacterium]
MVEITFRDAGPADKDLVLAIVSAAFSFPPESGRWHHMEQMFTLPGRHWRLVEVEGQSVATLCVTVSRLRVGEGHLVKADVGEVAVLPERQGQGIGTALMQDTVAWMRGQGYDFSRLGGLVRFYSRFGYVPFVRRYVEFYLRPGVGAGAATVMPAYLRRPSQLRVFPLDPGEWPHCQEMDKSVNAWRTGAFLDTAAAPPPDHCLVYREGDTPLAWVQLVEHPIDRTEFESRLTIGIVAWEPGREDAIAALVAHVLRLAHERGYDHVSARLPFEPALFAALTEAELPYKAVELHEAAAATMVQVLNLRSFFEHLLPELDRRWCQADLPLSADITIEMAGQTVTVSLRPGNVLLSEKPAQMKVSLSSPTLLALAMGLHAPSYLLGRTGGERHPRLAVLLGVLFPEQLATSSTWG